MMRRLHVRRVDDIDAARIDDDQLRAFTDAALHSRTEHRVAVGRIRADHHDHVGFVDRGEGLRAGRFAERGLQAVAGRRVAHACAGVDVVVAERGAHELLYEIRFFVRAARRRNAADRIAAILRLNAPEFRCRITECFFPADFAPRIGDLRADHRLGDAVLVRCVAPCEAALHARVTFVRLAVLVRHHPHDLVALHLRLERATDAAIRARGDDRMLSLAEHDDGLLLQGRRRARGDACAARHAFRFHERLVFACGDARFETAPGDGQRKRALRFLARAHAAIADDALRRVVREIRIRFVFLVLQMVRAIEAVAHFAQAGDACHVLQFAVAVGGAGQAVERVIGDVQLHHVTAQRLQTIGLRAHFHTGFDRRRARSGVAALAFDLDQTQTA